MYMHMYIDTYITCITLDSWYTHTHNTCDVHVWMNKWRYEYMWVCEYAMLSCVIMWLHIRHIQQLQWLTGCCKLTSAFPSVMRYLAVSDLPRAAAFINAVKPHYTKISIIQFNSIQWPTNKQRKLNNICIQ